MHTLSLHGARTVALLGSVAMAACHRARALPAGCESVLNSAPSASVARLTDSTPPRLAVITMTPFPFHRPLPAVQVSLYADTVESRANTPLRTGSTDSNAHLDLAPVPAGRYGVRARVVGAEPFFTVVALRASPSDSLALRLVVQEKVCY